MPAQTPAKLTPAEEIAATLAQLLSAQMETRKTIHDLLTHLVAVNIETRDLLKEMRNMRAQAQSRPASSAANGPALPSGVLPPASDDELDSQYGDEVIKHKPRDWTGDECKGRKMSDCPPAFLDMLADSMEYFAAKKDAAGEKDDRGRPKSFFDRKTASRARGWARRMRAGWTKPVEEETSAAGDFGDGNASSPFD